MQELRELVRHSSSQNQWVDRLLRLLLVVVLTIVLGLVGTAYAEYRLLYAVASLPHADGAVTRALDCPPASVTGSDKAVTSPPDNSPNPQVRLMLPGFRCTIPPYPD